MARNYYNTIAVIAANNEQAQAAKKELQNAHPTVDHDQADVIVALGGDGTMLRTIHRFIDDNKPIYGMHCGSIGFLMNAFSPVNLLPRINNAIVSTLYPLVTDITDADGTVHRSRAINEVSLLRETQQSAKLRIMVDGVVRLDMLICDGALVSSPAGSTAYNLSAHGPILPRNAPILALTPINAFRPRRWRGALLPSTATITFEVLETNKRSVNAVADYTQIRHAVYVDIREDRSISSSLLFDPGHDLEDRILREQFQT